METPTRCRHPLRTPQTLLYHPRRVLEPLSRAPTTTKDGSPPAPSVHTTTPRASISNIPLPRFPSPLSRPRPHTCRAVVVLFPLQDNSACHNQMMRHQRIQPHSTRWIFKTFFLGVRTKNIHPLAVPILGLWLSWDAMHNCRSIESHCDLRGTGDRFVPYLDHNSFLGRLAYMNLPTPHTFNSRICLIALAVTFCPASLAVAPVCQARALVMFWEVPAINDHTNITTCVRHSLSTVQISYCTTWTSSS